MERVLFLGTPAYGHINPTLGIIAELVKQGKEVVYFCSEEFRERIEKTGAIFRSYCEWDAFPLRNKTHTHIPNKEDLVKIFEWMIHSCEKTIDSILEQIKDKEFDAIGYSASFPYASIMAQILKIPSFSSFAVFVPLKEILPTELQKDLKEIETNHPVLDKYKELSLKLHAKYKVEMPRLSEMFCNRGDLNFAYTSKDFDSNIEDYDDTFKFIGPPIYDREEDISDFPYDEIRGKKVIYISLGTVFSNFNKNLYPIFFKAFQESDAVVVMTAYNTDLSEFEIPENFIIRNYISQTEILKYADVAVTHSGMNSTNDLLFNHVPFVAIPLGADQPYMASRAEKLGACISLDMKELTPEILRDSVNKAMTDPRYIENIKKINESFKKCGGYKRAVDEILNLR